MILLVLVASLVVSLSTIYKYIITGVHSRTQRLLPVVLSLIILTDFYQVVEYLTKEQFVFEILEKLLMVQMLYLLVYYIRDILQIHYSKVTQICLFADLLVANVVIFAKIRNVNEYDFIFWLVIVCYVSIILYQATRGYFSTNYSRQERRVNLMMYMALEVPSVCLAVRKIVPGEWNETVMPLALSFTCGIIYYLLHTQQLVDTMTLMKENIYDTSDIAVILFDEDYYYLDANEAARDLFPKRLRLVPIKRSKKPYTMLLSRILANPDNSPEFQVNNGDYYQCRLQPVLYKNRQKGYILTFINITKQKHETYLMAQLKEMAEEQTLSKSRFLANMSHELRSPLHAIIGISDIMLAQQDVEGRNRSLMLYVKSAGNTLLELVNSILIFSKLESGKLELAKAPYDLENILEDLTSMCVVNLQNKPVQFSVSLLSVHPSRMLGDGIRVREMLQNLLSNAVKFTEKGEIRCEITCKPEDNGYRISCMVSDTGPGMSKEQILGIFKEYSSYSGEKHLEGTGLGLCIVKQLAELMNGEVSVQSDGKSGSVFSFTIYQEAAPEASLRPAVSFNEGTLMRSRALGVGTIVPHWVYPQAKVLLADDMKVNQEIFKGLVRPWKFSVDTVDSGQEAIDALKTTDYQMIFLDMMMPDMTGAQTAAAIKKEQDVPLVLVTANLSDDTKEFYTDQGFQAFLGKPIDMGQLQNTIENLIPEEYREQYDNTMAELAANNTEEYVGNSRGYRRMLEAFVAEAEQLIDEIPDYAVNDHALFQTKVHGIKGASIQIGKAALSETAEIMEMAAKTDNFTFVDSHIERFTGELRNALEEVKNELARMPIQTDMLTPLQETQTVEVLFTGLKEGFENYDMTKIEDNLHALGTSDLNDKQRQILEKVRAAYEELEYETGAELLKDF